jgi:hypothetical protein
MQGAKKEKGKKRKIKRAKGKMKRDGEKWRRTEAGTEIEKDKEKRKKH